MKLDKKERLALVNQFLILEKLYPEEAEYYAQHRQAVAEGYELHYEWIYENLWEGLNQEECNLVLSILDMYSALHFSAAKSENRDFTEHFWLNFKGFDGNNESSYMAYCSYFIVTLGRFDELRYGKKFPDFNSHMPSIQKYNAMLNMWKELGKSYELDDDSAIAILEAQ